MKLLLTIFLLAAICMSYYLANRVINTDVSITNGDFGFSGSGLDMQELSQFDSYQAISRKPLFDQDREPVKIVVEKKPTIEKVVAKPLAVQALGIAVSGERLLAVVKDLRTGKVHRLRVNDAVEGWTLIDVSTDSFVFAKAGVEKTVKFKTN